ncbi:MAG: class I SAM-dependent methyltransferase, partial [Candidatus Omnitrophica bacterium]|nr:class I SAM-dependent methyltransferase [Candidatus Omnitrophota bacterium]
MRSIYIQQADRFGWGIQSQLNRDIVSVLEKFAKGPRVIDIGCGGGQYVDYLNKKGFFTVGVDFINEFLSSALKYKREGHFVCADAEVIPFKDKTFDTVFSSNLLEHIKDDNRIIKEFFRIAKSRIILIVPLVEPAEFKGYGVLFFHRIDETHLRYYTREDILNLLKDFRCEVLYYEEFFPVDITGLFIST